MKAEKKTRIMMFVNAIIIVLLILNFLYFYNTRYKIAYVKSAEVVYGYKGMKEANQRLTAETAKYKSAIDSLDQEYSLMVSDYKAKVGTMPEAERIKKEEELNMLFQRNQNYKAQIQSIIDQKDQELTQGVLTQINSFVAEYGKKHGYDVVFGTGNGGLILYGSEGIDITKDLLEELNDSFYPESGNIKKDANEVE